MYNMPRAATIVATSEGTLWAMVSVCDWGHTVHLKMAIYNFCQYSQRIITLGTEIILLIHMIQCVQVLYKDLQVIKFYLCSYFTSGVKL